MWATGRLLIFHIPMPVHDQHFAVLERQHVLLLGAVALHGIDPVREFLARRRRVLLGPDRDLAAQKKHRGKSACRTAHEMAPLQWAIAYPRTDTDSPDSRSRIGKQPRAA